MMIRNGLLWLAAWIIALATYLIILVPWILGYHADLAKVYRPIRWLDKQRVVKCKNCGFIVRRNWNFCPVCANLVQRSLIDEMERKTFAHKLKHMFKVKLKRNLLT